MDLLEFGQVAYTRRLSHLGLPVVLSIGSLAGKQQTLQVSSRHRVTVALIFSPTASPALETANPFIWAFWMLVSSRMFSSLYPNQGHTQA